MRVKLIKPWGVFSAGHYLDVQSNQLKILVARGIAEVDRDDKPVRQRKPVRPVRSK